MRFLLASVLAVIFANVAIAQDATNDAKPDREYPTAAAALDAIRAKSGVKISVQSGWTVIEDRSTLSIWSFTPPGHPAHPAAIHRKVVQQGDNLFIKMNVLCEAPKSACDAMVAEFQNLNGQVSEHLKR
jgi:hypothetical protein